MSTLSERLRAMYAARKPHFQPPGSSVPAFAVVATDERLKDLLDAADQLELVRCGCGDEFTANDPGTCGNCKAGETAVLHVEIERLTAELDVAKAGLALVQQHHATAWNRGHAAGLRASQEQIENARNAVRSDAWGNSQLTEALMSAEAERDALRAELAAMRGQEPPAQVDRLTDEWLMHAAGATLYLHHRPAIDRLVRKMRDVMMYARDDVQAELQRCTELAGRPQTDRRLAAQEELARLVDEAISAADQWLKIQHWHEGAEDGAA